MTGSSDDGGIANHASATVASGGSATLEIEKSDANALRFELWYPPADRYDVTIQTPTAAMGPLVGPAANTANTSQNATGVAFFHYGSSVTTSGAVTRRQILIDFSGPAGRYSRVVKIFT